MKVMNSSTEVRLMDLWRVGFFFLAGIIIIIIVAAAFLNEMNGVFQFN